MATYQTSEEHSNKAILLQRCAAAIRQIEPGAEIILYGSEARGEAHIDSDIDLLVLVQREATPELKRAISDRIYDLELETDQLVSLVIYQRSAWNSEPLNITPLHRAIRREGVPI